MKGALQVSGEHSGSPIVPTMERIPTTEQHPTYHRTNKYTAGYQVGSSKHTSTTPPAVLCRAWWTPTA